ncbi:hypothetical protein BRC88_13380 [Halobacteriales archaeon QS_4_69_225]|nr:MAG: hypothetical protein BRC88_13380 [Halobacteriales archaeon QS_4_69_225]
MSTVSDDSAMAENCEACDGETPHEVGIRLLTESHKNENAEFSREPYRVTACRICGEETLTRMNDV